MQIPPASGAAARSAGAHSPKAPGTCRVPRLLADLPSRLVGHGRMEPSLPARCAHGLWLESVGVSLHPCLIAGMPVAHSCSSPIREGEDIANLVASQWVQRLFPRRVHLRMEGAYRSLCRLWSIDSETALHGHLSSWRTPCLETGLAAGAHNPAPRSCSPPRERVVEQANAVSWRR